jgi:hypothetical protein
MVASAFDDTDVYDILKSASRRKFEVRLFQQYVSQTSHTLPLAHTEGPVRHAWSVDVPNLALEHENVLYGIFAFSALHLLHLEPANHDLVIEDGAP